MNPNAILKDYEKSYSSNRKRKKDEIYFWINSTFSFLLAFIAILFVYYVWILNTNATQWYDIIHLEKEKQDLLLQKELLDVKISNLESLKLIENEDNFDNIMEEVENPDFAIIRNWVNYAYVN